VPAVVGGANGPSVLPGWPGFGTSGYPSPIFGGPALSPSLVGGGGADCCCPDGVVLWPVAATSPISTYFTSLAFCYRY
jgi:hypothetical protein